ncbi:MAG: hypothetical protein AAF333_13090 [Planctomycetota bacterium]
MCRPWMILGCCVLSCGLWGVPPAAGQFVDGEWVQRGEASIRKYRMTNAAFLVLDAEGKLAADAEVRLEQEAHAFRLGWALRDRFPEAYDPTGELWRVFNEVSLKGLTSWRDVQPDADGVLRSDAIRAALDAAEEAGLSVHWGNLLSAEPFDLPEWVVPLRGQALYYAALAYALEVADTFGPRIDGLDLCDRLPAEDDPRFSAAMLRLIEAHLNAGLPGVESRLRVDGAWQSDRASAALGAMDVAANEQLGRDGFSASDRFPPRAVAQDQIEPALRRIAKVGRPLRITGLEVGGTHGIETTVNVETVVRTLFAEPSVTGITFAGLGPSDFADASATLIDEQGQPTGAGLVLDRLFRTVWWSDETTRTDELGRAQTRVFLGDYTVTATLADGATVSMPLRLRERDDSPEPIILMPVKAGGAGAD